MTRKDYCLLANHITRALRDDLALYRPDVQDIAADAMRTVVDNLCNALASDNPRFNRARFITACGL